MKNPFVRWAVFVLGGLAVVGAILAGALAFFLSRYDARAEIEKAVEQATGRQMTIAGSVGISFFPVLGLSAREASLANVEGGRAPALAAMDAIHVGVEISPLVFRREIVVRSLVLDKPKVALEVDAEGAPNWVLTPARPSAPTTAPTAPAPQPPAFTLKEVRVNDGEVSYVDMRSNTGWLVSSADLLTALTGLDEPMRITGDVLYSQQEIDLDLTIGAPRAAIGGQATPVRLALSSELLEAQFDGRTSAAAVELGGDVRAHGPSLRRLAEWLGAPLTGAVGFENFAVQGQLAIAGGEYAFSNAALVIDRLRARGDFTVRQAGAGTAAWRPYVSGRLELFDLDLNPYLTGAAPPAEDGDAEGELAAIEAGKAPALAEVAAVEAAPRALDVEVAPADTPIDFSGLKALNADLELKTAALRLQSMSIDGARLTLVLNDGFLALTLQQLDLYGGVGTGRLMIDAREPAVRIEQDLSIVGVDANTILKDAANFDNLEGTAEISIGTRTRGRTQAELIAATDGRAHIEVRSGALRGVDLGGISETIGRAWRGDLVGPDKRTAFNGFSATFSVADGVLGSDSLSFNTPQLTIPGLAVLDLVNRRMDVRLAPRSPRGGLVFPFTVRGPWAQPAYNSDLRGIAQRELQARIEEIKRGSRER